MTSLAERVVARVAGAPVQWGADFNTGRHTITFTASLTPSTSLDLFVSTVTKFGRQLESDVRNLVRDAAPAPLKPVTGVAVAVSPSGQIVLTLTCSFIDMAEGEIAELEALCHQYGFDIT